MIASFVLLSCFKALTSRLDILHFRGFTDQNILADSCFMSSAISRGELGIVVSILALVRFTVTHFGAMANFPNCPALLFYQMRDVDRKDWQKFALSCLVK